MARRVALVSCVKSKGPVAAPAGELYTSDLFRKMRRYANATADEWYILSAQYGMLPPDKVIAPYERTLNKMPTAERLAWAHRVQHQLLEALPPGCEVIMLAGERYREDLVPFLREHGFEVTIPLEGLSFGRQLQKLAELGNPGERI